MQKKNLGAVWILLALLTCMCCACSSGTKHAAIGSGDSDYCDFVSSKSQPMPQKAMRPPAPKTPIGGDFSNY